MGALATDAVAGILEHSHCSTLLLLLADPDIDE
jgi:hypothetical protein